MAHFLISNHNSLTGSGDGGDGKREKEAISSKNWRFSTKKKLSFKKILFQVYKNIKKVLSSK